MAEDHRELLELYRLHSEEVRFQLQLNWDRAKSSLAFHAALLTIIASLNRIERGFVPWMFLFTAVSAILGTVMLRRSHEYYRAARDQRKRVEEKLETAFPFVTTPGMRGESHAKKLKVTTVLVALHWMIAVLSVVGAVVYA